MHAYLVHIHHPCDPEASTCYTTYAENAKQAMFQVIYKTRDSEDTSVIREDDSPMEAMEAIGMGWAVSHADYNVDKDEAYIFGEMCENYNAYRIQKITLIDEL